MGDEEIALFEAYLNQELKKELEKVTKKAEEVLKEKVESNVYKEYTPMNYSRSDDLKNSITSKCDPKEGLVYFDESKLGHSNAYGDNIKLVPEYLEYGWKHDNWNGGVDNYHERRPTKFIEDAIQELEKEYRDIFKFMIVDD